MPKNKVKLNDKVDNKKKAKKVKPEKYISEEAKEVRRFVIILISIIVIVLIIYGVTKIFVKDEKAESTNNVTAGEINYDVVSIGTMLNRKPSEYYVIIYDQESTDAVIYSALISKYLTTENASTIYFCNLGNKLNSSYYVGEEGTSNPSAKTIDELALKELTLIKVKNGQIVKYIEDLDTIKTELGI